MDMLSASTYCPISLSDLIDKCAGLENGATVRDREVSTLKTELSSAKTEFSRKSQEVDRVEAKASQLEQRIKELQQDHECQRHNFEATKLNLEKKLKEQVKKRNCVKDCSYSSDVFFRREIMEVKLARCNQN